MDHKTEISELRAKVSEVPNEQTDFDLLRWLQRNNFDVNLAAPKLRNFLRLMNSWDYKRYVGSPVAEEYWGFYIADNLKDDNVVVVETTGRADHDGLYKSVSATDFIRARTANMENNIMGQIRKKEKATGKQARMHFVMDMECLEVTPSTVAMISTVYKDYVKFFDTNYPETVGKIFIVNVYDIFYKAYNAFKAFIPASLTGNLIILGDNWKTDILEHISAESLPIHWGGTSANVQPYEVLVPHNKVPEELYWSPTSDDYPMSELTSLPVYPGSYEFLTYNVNKEGAVLSWYFFASTNFGFGVYYTKDENEKDVEKMEMMYPDFGYMPTGTVRPEVDQITCHKKGFYKLRFNNYPSWFTTLEIHHKIICNT